MQNFPRFMDLPPELRIQIWQNARPKPEIHVFDVCIPTCSPAHTKESIERFRLARHKSDIVGQVFLDQIIIPQTATLSSVETDTDIDNQQNSYCSIESAFSFDPSAYLVTDAVQQSCREADSTLEFPPCSSNRANTTDFNSVHLPAQGRDKRVWYDNSTDVLFLRSGVLVSTDLDILVHNIVNSPDYYTGVFKSNLLNLMEHNWSPQFASTLKNARRLALDASEITSECVVLGVPALSIIFRKVKELALFLRPDLECLYIVDHCIGRCGKCGKGSMDMDKIAVWTKEGREVFALEELGWNEASTEFLIARDFALAFRNKQMSSEPQKPCFQGVRVLACTEWQSS